MNYLCAKCTYYIDDIPNPFAGPDVKKKLRESEKTKAYMEDPAFVKIIEELEKDTQALVKHMSNNKVMTALAVLLDVDITVPECRFNGLWLIRGLMNCTALVVVLDV